LIAATLLLRAKVTHAPLALTLCRFCKKRSNGQTAIFADFGAK